MSLRTPAGFIRPGYDPLKVPNAPTIGTATAGAADSGQASVAFTAPTNVGGSAITAYYAVSNPGQITATGASSPVTVTGLTNDTAYTFQVWALNSYGPGVWSSASGSITPISSRGVFGGGEGPVNVIDYVSIATMGNATDFGDLLSTAAFVGACASDTRGCFATSYLTSSIQYITIASTGNSTNFGDLSDSRNFLAGCNSSTRGLFGGGDSSTYGITSRIDYITIASTGNATFFGSLTVTRRGLASCSSSTRGVWAGGYGGSPASSRNTIDYVTIATTGNATSFGTLGSGTYQGMSGCSSGTRGVFAFSTTTTTNSLTYITIASTGNSTVFGDLVVSTAENMSTSSSTRGLFAGGLGTVANSNKIDYITIATTGNATDFGDLTVARRNGAGLSNANGGLQ